MTRSNPPANLSSNELPAIRRVVFVGHCGFDQGALMRSVGSALPGVELVSVNKAAGLSGYTHPDALLLINRVLDGRFSTASGIDLIAELSDLEPAPRMMLISNYADAQAQAEQVGALPGFGKSEMGSDQAAAMLRSAAGLDPA